MIPHFAGISRQAGASRIAKTEAGPDKHYLSSLGFTECHNKSPTDYYRMRIEFNFIPARRDIPPVSTYMEKIIPVRWNISPCQDGIKTSQQDGTG